MAQIKKFQNGGGLYLDGVKLTDEQINAAMGSLSAEDKYTWSKSIDRVRAGERVDLNELSNSVSGGDFSHVLSDKQLEKNTSGNLNRRQRDRHARRGTEIDTTNRGIANGIAALKSQLSAKASKPSTQSLGIGSGWFNFGEDGVYNNGPQNLTNEKLIRNVFAWLGGNDEYRKGWTVSGYGDNETLNGLTNWYNGQSAEDLIGRIKNNKLTEDDYDVLAAMGFSPNKQSEEDSTPGTSHKDWLGNAKAAKQAGVYFTKDKDGRWTINSSSANNQYLNTDWYGGGLDFLEGTDYANGFIGADGKLYTQAEILGGDSYRSNAINKFLSANSDQYSYKDWYDITNGSVRYKGDRTDLGLGDDEYGLTSYNPYLSWNSDWYNYFKGLGDGDEEYFLNDISGNYDNLNGKKIIAYADPSGAKDAIGIKKLKYAVRDQDGQFTTYDSEDALKNAGYVAKNQWWSPAPGVFNNAIWDVNVDGTSYAKAHTIISKDNQENTILVDRSGKYYLGRQKDGEWQSPKLIQNMPLFDNVVENPTHYNNAQLEALYNNVPRNNPVMHKVTNMTNAQIISQKIPANKRVAGAAVDRNGVIVSTGMFGKKQYWNEETGEWTSKYPLLKIGGSVPRIRPLPGKFQYGGAVGKSKTETNIITSEGAKTDITSSHKLNGSDGGLTSAEKLQIAAAIGDLAGVGISLAPGAGNIAGAATGLAATGTRLVADIKKDGFQASDLWSAAGSALLDLATLIPVLGTGAKTLKAIKVVKAAATPIMKALSIAGAAKGVAAMGKVLRGEDVTTDDLTAIISGLGSTAIAGKQIKDTVGDAKLAKKLASRAAKSANDSNNSEILGTLLPKSRKEIATLISDSKSEKEAVSKIQSLLKSSNPNASTSDARKVLQEWGVDVTRSRFSGKKGWKEYVKIWKKGEKQVSFDTPKEQEAGSTLYYMMNPFARRKQIGFDWGIKSSKGNLDKLTKQDVAVAERMLSNGSRSSLAKAIARRTVDNPSAFSFELDKTATRMNRWGFPTYMRKLKTVPQPQPQPIPQTLMLPAPQKVLMLPAPKTPVITPGPKSLPAPKQVKLLSAPGLDPKVRTKLDPFEQMGFYGYDHPSYAMRERIPLMPGESGYFVPTNRVSNGWLSRNFDPMFEFKDGGKILKAQWGLGKWDKIMSDAGINIDLSNIGSKPNTSSQSNSWQPIISFNEGDDGISTRSLVQQAITNRQKELDNNAVQAWNDYDNTQIATSYADGFDAGLRDKKDKYNIAMNASKDAYNFSHPNVSVKSDETKNKLKDVGNVVGNTSSKLDTIGAMVPALGNIFANYGIASKATDDQTGIARENYLAGLRGLPTNKSEYYSRYQDAGLDKAYDDEIARIESIASRTPNADPMLRLSSQTMASDKTTNLALTRDREKSHKFQTWLTQLDAARKGYADDRTDNTNIVGEKAAQLESYFNLQRAAGKAQKSAINQGFVSDLGKLTAIPRQTKMEQDYTDTSRNYSDWLAKLKNEYATGVDNGTINTGTTFDTWLSSDQNRLKQHREYQDKLATIKAKAKYTSLKKGGSIRPEAEQKRIDQQKYIANATKQLSKQAFEFLKMALS